MDGEAGGVSQRLLPGVRGGAAGGAGADVRCWAHFLDPDPASGILETLGMHGVREGSACNDEDAARVQVGRIIYSGARRVHFLGGFPEPDAVAAFWIGRIAAPVGAALLLRHLLRTPQEPTLKARLETIQPATDTVCPFCGRKCWCWVRNARARGAEW